MSNEFIEELRNHAAARTGYTTELIGKAADAIESQAATIARCEVTEENCDLLRSQVEAQAREIERLGAELEGVLVDWGRIRLELSALKAQPGGVVLPERIAKPATRTEESFGYRNGWNACLDEVARLNQPASSGDPCMCGGNPHTTQCLYEHFLSYSGLSDQPILRYAYFHGADDHCEKPATAGDERAAFEAWYLGRFYMGDKQCGLEWLSTEPCGGYRHQHPAEQWIVWQARAALSANPSDQVWEVGHDGWRQAVDNVSAYAHLYNSGFGIIHEIRAEYARLLAAAPSAGGQKEQK